MAHIGELPLCPATPAFPGRLCIAPSSVACALADICAHASRVFGLLRSAVNLTKNERFTGLVVVVGEVGAGYLLVRCELPG